MHKDLVLLGNDTLKAVRLSDGKEVWSISMQGLLNKNRWSPATVSEPLPTRSTATSSTVGA